MELISKETAWQIAREVIPRRNFIPDVIEDWTVKKNQEKIVESIHGSLIPIGSTELLKKELRRQFFFSLVQPGECVGISCAQAIGECVTQSALNTFHKAGLDTGVSTVMKSIEDIIDVPRGKNSKKHVVYTYHVTHRKLSPLNEATKHYITEVLIKNILVGYNFVSENLIPDNIKQWANAVNVKNLPNLGGYIEMTLNLSVIFNFRIDCNIIRRGLGRYAIVPPFCSARKCNDGDSYEYKVYVPVHSQNDVIQTVRTLSKMHLVGIPGARGHSFSQDANGDWFVIIEGAPISEILSLHNIYDPTKTTTTRVSDIAEIFGVYASRVALQVMGSEVLGESVCKADMTILATKITCSSQPMPCTRFTMRNNPSPLAKIAFEESQGGCRNAGLYRETEHIRTMSSIIILGKHAPIGSMISTPIMDTKSYFKDQTHTKHNPFDEELYCVDEDDDDDDNDDNICQERFNIHEKMFVD